MEAVGLTEPVGEADEEASDDAEELEKAED